MSTLYTFGCSYTADYELDGGKYDELYNIRGGNFPDVWSKVLAKKLNFELNNFGKGGVGNDFIFNQICKNFKQFKKNDIVIVGWSYINRYKWVDFNSNLWAMANCSMCAVSKENNQIIHDEMSFNRTHPLYVEEVYDYMKLIDYLSEQIGFDLYYWSGDCNLIYPIPKSERQDKKFLISNLVGEYKETPFNEVFKLGGKRIFEETNNIVDDYHFGETGHKIMGELFYNHIINFKNKLI
jgi:hypothetical protein